MPKTITPIGPAMMMLRVVFNVMSLSRYLEHVEHKRPFIEYGDAKVFAVRGVRRVIVAGTHYADDTPSRVHAVSRIAAIPNTKFIMLFSRAKQIGSAMNKHGLFGLKSQRNFVDAKGHAGSIIVSISN
jgi:hypothetical protein